MMVTRYMWWGGRQKSSNKALHLTAIPLFGQAPIMRVTLPDTPAPASSTLERVFYPDAEDIISAVKKVCNHKITRD